MFFCNLKLYFDEYHMHCLAISVKIRSSSPFDSLCYSLGCSNMLNLSPLVFLEILLAGRSNLAFLPHLLTSLTGTLLHYHCNRAFLTNHVK